MNGTAAILACAALALGACASADASESADKAQLGKVTKSCTLNGKNLYGKVQIVDAFPDFKVEHVTAFPDLKVEVVTAFPTSCGKWEFVTAFPNFKVQFVTAFPDFKIQYVTAFPGVP